MSFEEMLNVPKKDEIWVQNVEILEVSRKNSVAAEMSNSRRAALKMEHPWYTYVAELSKYEYKGVGGGRGVRMRDSAFALPAPSAQPPPRSLLDPCTELTQLGFSMANLGLVGVVRAQDWDPQTASLPSSGFVLTPSRRSPRTDLSRDKEPVAAAQLGSASRWSRR
ncbi:hypothetical protein B0H13DRAFT_1851588 [Mycena leptocephala]|nr:hypothetical protein B0H13DRAFT_1851588 [Mycena leptocephala]